MRDTGRLGLGRDLVRVSSPLAALLLFDNHRASLSDLRRNPIGDRVLSSRFLERMEMEPAGVRFSVRVVDLRRLRIPGFGVACAPLPDRSVHANSKTICSSDGDSHFVFELGLSARPAARFVLARYSSAGKAISKLGQKAVRARSVYRIG